MILIAVVSGVLAFIAIRSATPDFFRSFTSPALNASVRATLERSRLLLTITQGREALSFGLGCALLWFLFRSNLAGRSRGFKAAALCVCALLLPGAPLTVVLELSRSSEWAVFGLSLVGAAIYTAAIVGVALSLISRLRSPQGKTPPSGT